MRLYTDTPTKPNTDTLTARSRCRSGPAPLRCSELALAGQLYGTFQLYLNYNLSISYPISYPISYLFFFYILSYF